mgnify:CR=1 FL=1
MHGFQSYGETSQHKVRIVSPMQNNSGALYGINLPRELGQKYFGTFFTVVEDIRGTIVLQSGAKLNGK